MYCFATKQTKLKPSEPAALYYTTPTYFSSAQTGVVLTRLPAYQRLFATFRFFRQVLVNEVSTVFRLSYDGSRQQVYIVTL